MSSYSNQDSSNRSRGGRNRSRRRGPDNRNSSTRSTESRSDERVTRAPKKKSLWQKILSFFGGNSVPAPKPTGRTSAPKKTESAPAAKRTQSVRRPEPIEVTSPRVYVGNLSFDATESDLLELFSGVGSVQNAEIVFNKDTHRSKGFGFIQMASMEEASRAVSELHDKEYMGRKLVVSGAKAVQESRQPRNTAPSPEASSEEQSPSAA
ncbi:MAG: hypothetical protein ABI443_07595 [Chthoniobacterales bacterium]